MLRLSMLLAVFLLTLAFVGETPSVGTAAPLPGSPDSDFDGVPDDIDNCPSIPNVHQENIDRIVRPPGDGLGDECDDNDDNDGCGDATEILNNGMTPPRLPNNSIDPKDMPDATMNPFGETIGFQDFLILLAAWGQSSATPGWDWRADFDGSSVVGFGDFVLMLGAWGRTCS